LWEGSYVARPIKEGIDYFTFDVDMDTDDKIYMIEAEHGLEGFAILVKLLMEIYRNGYYYPWNERTQLVFSGKRKIDLQKSRAVAESALQCGFFNSQLFENFGILTSHGIQKRFIQAKKRHKKVEMFKEYFLLSNNNDENETITLLDVPITPSNVDAGTHRIGYNRIGEDIPSNSVVNVAETSPKTAVANRPIYHIIESAFLSQAPQIGELVEFNFKREGPHIKELEKKALARGSAVTSGTSEASRGSRGPAAGPLEGAEEFAKTVIVVFWRLIHSDDQFWKHQPFLPSVLNSGGIWPRVLKEMENHQEEQLDDRLQEIIGGLKF